MKPTQPRLKPATALAAAAIAIAPPVCAQDAADTEASVQELKPATLHAHRFEPTPVDDLGSATVITEEELERRQPQSVFDALHFAPGVNIRRSGGRGTASSISIRGLGSEQALIMVDGIPLRNGASTSQANLDLIQVGDVQQIEILRGAHSVLHGADAVAGVINIVTKEGEREGTRGAAEVSGGARGTWSAQGNVSGRQGPWFYHAFAGYEETEGISAQGDRNNEDDDFENRQASVSLGRKLSDRGELELTARRREAQIDFDSAGPDDPNAHTDADTAVVRARGEYAVSPDFWRIRGEASWTHFNRLTRDNFGGANLDSVTYNYEFENAFDLSATTRLIVGAEYEEIEAESAGQFDRETDTLSLYGLARQTLWQHVTLEGGLRNDDNSQFGSQTTARGSLAWDVPRTETRVHASFGTSFRAPRLADQFSTFGGFAAPNPNLGPETGESFDLGVEHVFLDERITADLTYFQNDIEDQITFDFSTFPAQFRNLDSVRTQGIESSFDIALMEHLDLRLNYTWTSTLQRGGGGPDLLRIPEHEGSGILNYRFLEGRANVNLRGRYVGPRPGVGGDELGGYAVWDVSAHYDLTDNLRIRGRVENIFDREYEVIDGFATPGLGVFAGLRYAFD